jgi:hypothetical protein
MKTLVAALALYNRAYDDIALRMTHNILIFGILMWNTLYTGKRTYSFTLPVSLFIVPLSMTAFIHTESTHLLGRLMTTAMLWDTLKEIQIRMSSGMNNI